VADLITEGLCNRDIARELNISVRTVKAHCARLFLDFNIDSGRKHKRVRLAAVILAQREAVAGGELASPLTPKQWDIIKMIAVGLCNREIATAIGTTEDVVRNYLSRIFDKLGVWSKLEVAVWYASRFPKEIKLEELCETFCCPYF
jgi:DNA-binding NarL/FixJ family response regulator